MRLVSRRTSASSMSSSSSRVESDGVMSSSRRAGAVTGSPCRRRMSRRSNSETRCTSMPGRRQPEHAPTTVTLTGPPVGSRSTPERRGGAVADHRARPAGQDRGVLGCKRRPSRGLDQRVDALVHAVKPPALSGPPDRSPPHPELEELSVGDVRSLAGGQLHRSPRPARPVPFACFSTPACRCALPMIDRARSACFFTPRRLKRKRAPVCLGLARRQFNLEQACFTARLRPREPEP